MGKKIYKYDENYFSTIDTYDKAYWLGFILADGYIIDNRGKDNKSDAIGLRIRLAESEKPHLEKLNEDINGNLPVKIVKNYGTFNKENSKLSEIHINSTQIVDDLYKLGLSSGNKSCNEKFIKFNDPNLTKNFILGMFDGDGYITKYNSWSKRDQKNRVLQEWGINSSKEFILEAEKFLKEQIKGIKFQKVTTDHRCDDLYRLRTSSKKTIAELKKYFYESNCTSSYLQRKYNMY